MLLLRNQVKVYHWQTNSFARHKATDDLVDKLDEHIDKFTEVYMGKYGRPKFTAKTSNLKLYDVTDNRGHLLLEQGIHWLENKLPGYLGKKDSDLLNIRDEIIADLNQVRYLFTLK